MDAENKALCYFYRHPPPSSNVPPSSYAKIADMVVKKDGEQPSVGGVFNAVKEFRKAKKVRGRRIGWRKTTKHEDKVIKATFHKLRPPRLRGEFPGIARSVAPGHQEQGMSSHASQAPCCLGLHPPN